MGRLILVEGLDLAGKSTLIQGLQQKFSALRFEVSVRHGDLCPNNPVARVTRRMMRWDPGFDKSEGAPLFLASHLWDLRNFKKPNHHKHIQLQDSCALRSLAFERVLGEPFYVQRLEEVVDRLPHFDAAYLLTASIDNRRKRFARREQNDLHDRFMLADPVRFCQVDSELLRLGVQKLGAKLICTDDLSPQQVLELVWRDLRRRLGWPDEEGALGA